MVDFVNLLEQEEQLPGGKRLTDYKPNPVKKRA
jgi:hypothetical protein